MFGPVRLDLRRKNSSLEEPQFIFSYQFICINASLYEHTTIRNNHSASIARQSSFPFPSLSSRADKEFFLVAFTTTSERNAVRSIVPGIHSTN
ncbi:hypothetical protein J6590_016856 [Homalodisca vitripennis]|nr:hypothetical protein J6590_016856 [Homalodisca vitripennis]